MGLGGWARVVFKGLVLLGFVIIRCYPEILDIFELPLRTFGPGGVPTLKKSHPVLPQVKLLVHQFGAPTGMGVDL